MESQYLHRSKHSTKSFRYNCKFSKKFVKDSKPFNKPLRKSDFDKDYEEFSDESDTDCEEFTEDEKYMNEIGDERMDHRPGGHLSYGHLTDMSLAKMTFSDKRMKSKCVDYSSLPFKILKKLRNHFGLTTSKKTQLVDAVLQKVCEKPVNDVEILKQFLMKFNN